MTPHLIISAMAFLPVLFSIATDTDVLDIKGHPLRAHSRYYILPVNVGEGGGLTILPKNRTSICPLYVAQEKLQVYAGLPVWFLPIDPKQHHVSLSSDLNILFNVVNICLQSAAWRLTLDCATGRRYVATGGAIGNPGEETLSSWFKIEKVESSYLYGNHYKIVFCPSVCRFCMVMCEDVGVLVQEDGTRLLGLSQHPLYVMFKKA
ncbi:Kunitz trypsin inhibitor 2 [Bienertia sinuspersici]